ncbi:MAG: tetratricopeptide repeat protein [Gemmatimonadaceae bacterium]
MNQRRATTAVALAFGLCSAPAALEAQTRTVNPQAPRVLVVVFSGDRAAGVEVSDAIRSRILAGINPRQITVIHKEQITTYLEGSGYRPDSSLGMTDLEALAKGLRADEVIGGHVTRRGDNLRIEPRMMLARDVTIAQALPAAEGGNVGALARQVERAYEDARRQLADNQACENGIRDGAFDRAIAAARAAVEKYPIATIARLCMASAYQAMMASQDSATRIRTADEVLRIVGEVRRLDPRSTVALRLAYAAQEIKGDNESAVRSLLSLMELEPNNPTLQGQVVTALAQLGKPEVALPLVDSLIAKNPGDPQLMRQRWLLTLNAAAADTVPSSRSAWFDKAVAAGMAMVRGDSTLADTAYFERQIAAAQGVTENPLRAVEITSRATQRYPQRASFWALKAQAERRAGQLQMAEQSIRRALSIDPRTLNGTLMLGAIFMELNRPDSALALTRRAVAAGEDRQTWGTFLLQPTQAVYKYADSVKTVTEYRRALGFAQASDSLAPSATAKFFIGVTSLNVAIASLQDAQARRNCGLARQAKDMFVLTQMNMPAGGSVDAATARTVLGYVAQYSPAADQMVTQYCR